MKRPSVFSRARGFTLVEMILTLAVFALLSGAIFGIITGVLGSAGSLQDNQNRTDEAMALQAYLQKELGAMPGSSVLGSYRRGDGEGLVQNGIIFGTKQFLRTIDAKLQANGLYTLRTAAFSSPGEAPNAPTAFTAAVSAGDVSLAWTNLLHDVRGVTWKFQEFNSPSVDTWDITASKPVLVELSLQIAGDLRPTTMDFWIPPVSMPPVSGLATVP
jgi:prepilin-type N-terminal cleavage/methylation domain-containing protein